LTVNIPKQNQETKEPKKLVIEEKT
jgi:hypothetical protein